MRTSSQLLSSTAGQRQEMQFNEMLTTLRERKRRGLPIYYVQYIRRIEAVIDPSYHPTNLTNKFGLLSMGQRGKLDII